MAYLFNRTDRGHHTTSKYSHIKCQKINNCKKCNLCPDAPQLPHPLVEQYAPKHIFNAFEKLIFLKTSDFPMLYFGVWWCVLNMYTYPVLASVPLFHVFFKHAHRFSGAQCVRVPFLPFWDPGLCEPSVNKCARYTQALKSTYILQHSQYARHFHICAVTGKMH